MSISPWDHFCHLTPLLFHRRTRQSLEVDWVFKNEPRVWGGAHEEAKILKIPCDRSSFNPEIKVGTWEFAVYTLLLACSDPVGHFVPFINACRSIKSLQQTKLNVLF